MNNSNLFQNFFGGKSLSATSEEGMQEVTANKDEVLIVDDDEMTRKLIHRLVERELDREVTTLGNGLEGFNYIQDHVPGLVILDLMLPGMNGYEVLKKIRNDEQLQDVKVVLVSAKSRSDDIERGFELSADEYITKPFQPGEFLARLRKLVAGK